MIVYNLVKVKKFSNSCIKKYEDTLNFNITRCPCCNSNKLIKWGTYTRNVIYFKNDKKYENTIEIKRIRCNDCKKTQSIIPTFLVPYKVHTTEYITETIKYKIIKNTTYNTSCDKYKISRQLLKYWLDCFDRHYSRISITLNIVDKRKVLRNINKTLYDFIYNYYWKNRIIYMMYMNDNFNRPILKWAPT